MSNDAHRCDPRDAAGARSNQITDEGVIRDLVEAWRTRSTLRGTRSIRSCGLKRDCILSRIKFYFKHFPSGPLLSPPPLSLPNVHQRLGQLEKLDCYFYEIRLKKDRGSYDPGLYDRLKNRGVDFRFNISQNPSGHGRGERRKEKEGVARFGPIDVSRFSVVLLPRNLGLSPRTSSSSLCFQARCRLRGFARRSTTPFLNRKPETCTFVIVSLKSLLLSSRAPTWTRFVGE